MNNFDQAVINYNPKNIIWNRICEKNNIKNFLCLLFKQFVYAKRCLKQALSLAELKCKVQEVRNIEKYNAIVKNNTEKFNKKWCKHQKNYGQALPDYIREYIDQI